MKPVSASAFPRVKGKLQMRNQCNSTFVHLQQV